MDNQIGFMKETMGYFSQAMEDMQAWHFLNMAKEFKDHKCDKEDCMICEAWSLKP